MRLQRLIRRRGPGQAGGADGGEGDLDGRDRHPVVVDGMVRTYGSVRAVDGIGFSVRPGEMFGLIGPDGAGKTTTLRAILGLLRPDRGRVRTCGLDPARQRRRLSRRVGYLSQRFSLYGDLSIDENVAFFAEVHGIRDWRPRRDELLETLRLSPFRGRLAERLSGGMKQKLALACTLIHTPELLVLDEPTTGVDPVSRREFWKILARLQRDGLTLVITTPYLDEAERCQRVALMNRGRVLDLGPPGEMRTRSGSRVIELVARPRKSALERLRQLPEVADVVVFGERLHVTPVTQPPSLPGPGGTADRPTDASRVDASVQTVTEGLLRRIERALRDAGIEVVTIREVEPTLEDAFIARLVASEGAER